MAKTGHVCGTDKLCMLTCCACGLDLKTIKPLVDAPKFICKTCGRVANEKENLCKPVRL
jgi:transposase-like protein